MPCSNHQNLWYQRHIRCYEYSIDSWTDQAAIDAHHASPMMQKIMELQEKYDLHMTAERFVSEEMGVDEKFIRKWNNPLYPE